MLLREDWIADNDGRGKRKAHGQDLDESTEQEGSEESAGSEKECWAHARQCRTNSQVRFSIEGQCWKSEGGF